MNRATHYGRFLRCLLALVVGLPILWSTQASSSFAHEGILLASLFGSDKGSAPDFELQDVNGTSVRLSKYKGQRPVLLYFWATWCQYCMAVKPEVAKLRERVERSELEILAINVGEGDSLDRLKRYQEAHPVKYPVLYDGGGKVSRSYHVQGIPLFILLDRDGKVVYRGNSLPDPVRYLK
jgi:peroxiredoxin